MLSFPANSMEMSCCLRLALLENIPIHSFSFTQHAATVTKPVVMKQLAPNTDVDMILSKKKLTQ